MLDILIFLLNTINKGGLIMKQIFLIFALLLLSACTNETVKNEETNTPNQTVNETPDQTGTNVPSNQTLGEVQNDKIVNYSKFFMPDESTAHFLGEGNEFATYTVHTKWLSDRYVALVENNGGVEKMKIYRVMNDEEKIVKVYDEVIEGLPSEVQYPSTNVLENMSVLEMYLNGPIEKGTHIGNWTIIDVNTTLETPYQTFKNVFVL
jgi:hypothetical protein